MHAAAGGSAPHTTAPPAPVPSTLSGHPIISFSHFLPRIELIPEKRFLYYPNLPKVPTP